MSMDTVNVDGEVLSPTARQAVISSVASNSAERCIAERDKVSNAVQGLQQVVVEEAHPHHQKPFGYDSFMEKMMAKAKILKRKNK